MLPGTSTEGSVSRDLVMERLHSNAPCSTRPSTPASDQLGRAKALPLPHAASCVEGLGRPTGKASGERRE